MRIEIELVLLGAVITAAQFVGKELFMIWKKYKIKRKDAQLQAEEDLITDSQKSIEIYRQITALSEKEVCYNNKETRRLMDNNMSVLINQRNTAAIIDDVIKHTAINRFVLFHTHNGNGQPNYFKPYKVSYLQYNALNPSVINKYQNIEVDNDYTKMLIEIQENDSHFVKRNVSDMDCGLLKTIYTKENVKYSEVYFLCATNSGIIYTSVASTEAVADFDSDRLEISLAISKLKEIFENERKRIFRDCIEREEIETRLKEIYIEKEQIKCNLKIDQKR